MLNSNYNYNDDSANNKKDNKTNNNYYNNIAKHEKDESDSNYTKNCDAADIFINTARLQYRSHISCSF